MYLKYVCKKIPKNSSSVCVPSYTFNMLSFHLDCDVTDNNEISGFELVIDSNFNNNSSREILPNISQNKSPIITQNTNLGKIFFYWIQPINLSII